MNLEAEAVRTELDRLGVVVEGLEESQLITVSRRVLESFDGEMPDVQELASIVDAVRFESRLAKVPDSPDIVIRCSGCAPHYRAHSPSGGGYFHSRECSLFPHQKVQEQPRNTRETKRLASVHRIEDSRTALDIRPRRPALLRPSAVHPACLAAHQDGGEPCQRCIPLLHSATCECDVCDQWWGRVDA